MTQPARRELARLVCRRHTSGAGRDGTADVSDDVWRTMAASINSSPVHHEPDLSGQTVLIIGGSSGIGLETARLARARGAEIILTARNPDRLHRVGLELGASIAAFDATDFDRLDRFFDALPAPIDHLLVTGPGPYYAPLAAAAPQRAWRSAGRLRPRFPP